MRMFWGWLSLGKMLRFKNWKIGWKLLLEINDIFNIIVMFVIINFLFFLISAYKSILIGILDIYITHHNTDENNLRFYLLPNNRNNHPDHPPRPSLLQKNPQLDIQHPKQTKNRFVPSIKNDNVHMLMHNRNCNV